MPTPPLPIPSTVYTGKTISELRSLSSTGTLGLLGNLILAKMEANEIIKIIHFFKIVLYRYIANGFRI